ncbi:MAG: hypothetical protein CME61_01845 [Halobacteriovoraceae bacterium]|nr:hypothetical protein [Halobacteriovoraceae bacterium]
MNSSLEKKTLEAQSSITMTILLVSFSMLFGTLFLGYLIYRFRADQWPPMGINYTNVWIPTLSTMLIIMSSFSFYMFEKNIIKGQGFKKFFWLTEFLIISFGVSQFTLWDDLKLMGINSDTGVFGSMIHGFTWIHAAHILIGFILVSYLYKYFTKALELKDILFIKNVGKCWHFLGLVWIVLYVILFLI